MISEKLEQGTILEIIKQWLECCGQGKRIDVGSMRVIIDLLNGSEDDFILFDNGGGTDFFVWSKLIVGDKFDAKGMVESDIGNYVYLYRIDGQEYRTKTPVWGALLDAIDKVGCEL